MLVAGGGAGAEPLPGTGRCPPPVPDTPHPPTPGLGSPSATSAERGFGGAAVAGGVRGGARRLLEGGGGGESQGGGERGAGRGAPHQRTFVGDAQARLRVPGGCRTRGAGILIFIFLEGAVAAWG